MTNLPDDTELTLISVFVDGKAMVTLADHRTIVAQLRAQVAALEAQVLKEQDSDRESLAMYRQARKRAEAAENLLSHERPRRQVAESLAAKRGKALRAVVEWMDWLDNDPNVLVEPAELNRRHEAIRRLVSAALAPEEGSR